MSVNIPALLSLFPEPSSASTSYDNGGDTIGGRCPYDKIISSIPDAFTDDFIAAMESVRSDGRWGRVFEGDLSDYDGDDSRADLALCGEFARRGLKKGGIDTAIRASGLYREKWEREDYRNNTIALAVKGVRAKAEDRPKGLLDLQNGKIAISTAEPAPRNWTIDGLLLPGKSAVLGGFGGVSKTQLAIQLSIAIALASPFMGKAVKAGGVMLILGEEDRAEIERRINAVVRHEKLNHEQIQRIEENMLAFPLVGHDMRLTAMDKGALTDSPELSLNLGDGRGQAAAA